MEHSFNIELAKEYGILEAILLKNIWFWIEKNRANEKNFYDGTYWTYNSTRAFNELFPYASESSIKRALKSLQEKEIIKTGNYNKSSYDRTLWYAFTDLGYSIVSNRQMEVNKSSNGDEQNGLTIPDINTNDKTKEYIDHFEIIWNIYPNKQGKAKALEFYLKWLKGRKLTGTTRKLTDRQMYYAVQKYKKECETSKKEIEYIKHGDTFFNKAILDYVEEIDE